MSLKGASRRREKMKPPMIITPGPMNFRWVTCAALGVVIAVALTGCSATRETTRTFRTSVEQLLISQSVERGLNAAADVLPPKRSVVVEVAGLTDDHQFAREIVVEWLRQQGWQIATKERKEEGKKTKEEGTPERYLVHVLMYALGTEQAQSFLGIPATQGTLIPISIPELAVYKAQRQHGYARFAFNLIETPSGRLIAASPVLEGTVYFNQYTVLFAFTFHKTDIVPPPP